MTDGYPEEEELKTIREWPAEDFYGLISYLENRWRWPEYIAISGNTAETHTGGWSGHEEMLGALRENHLWWTKYWYSSVRGGHYVFRKNASF
jgi:hypothetical protein